jgi:ribosomal protein S11
MSTVTQEAIEVVARATTAAYGIGRGHVQLGRSRARAAIAALQEAGFEIRKKSDGAS